MSQKVGGFILSWQRYPNWNQKKWPKTDILEWDMVMSHLFCQIVCTVRRHPLHHARPATHHVLLLTPVFFYPPPPAYRKCGKIRAHIKQKTFVFPRKLILRHTRTTTLIVPYALTLSQLLFVIFTCRWWTASPSISSPRRSRMFATGVGYRFWWWIQILVIPFLLVTFTKISGG